MKSVLFVGHFIPEKSYEAIANYYFCKKLKRDGMSVSLFSDSWCDADDEIFGSLDELTSNEIFEEKFFLDPFQVKNNEKRQLSMLGLFKKVIMSKDYDLIIISNFLDYGMLSFLAKEYNVQVALLQLGNDEWRDAFDDYIYEICPTLCSQFSLILTSPSKEGWISGIPFFRSIDVKVIDQLVDSTCEAGNRASLVFMQSEKERQGVVSNIQNQLNDFLVKEYVIKKNDFTENEQTIKKEISTIREFEEMLSSTDVLIDASEVFESNTDISRIEFWLFLGKQVLVSNNNITKISNVLKKKITDKWWIVYREEDYTQLY